MRSRPQRSRPQRNQQPNRRHTDCIYVTASPPRNAQRAVKAPIFLARNIMEPEQYDEVLNAMEIAMRELTPGTLAYERLRDAKDMILAHVPPGEEYIAVEGDSEAAWVPHPECRCHNCIMPGPHIRVATSTSVRADHTHLRYRNIRPEDDLFWLCADSRYRPEPPRHLLEDPDFLWCLDGCNGYASD